MKPKISLHDDEKIIFELQPKCGLIGYLLITKMWKIFISLIGLLVISYMYGLKYVDINWFIVVVIMTTIFSLPIFFWARYIVSQHYYFFTNQRAIIYSGAWGINKILIPYNRVVDVNMTQNPLHKFFNIAAVQIDEQSINIFSRKRSNRMLISGLDLYDAEDISNLISKESTSGSQLTSKMDK